MPLMDAAVQLVEPWRALYDDSTLLSTTVIAMHLTALLVGGGLAIAADRSTLRVSAAIAPERERQLAELGAVHRPVLVALVMLFASGIALTAADLPTFLASPIYWIKFGFVILLLANGLFMRRTERALGRIAHVGGAVDTSAVAGTWRHMRWSAWISIALWITTLVLGTALVNNA